MDYNNSYILSIDIGTNSILGCVGKITNDNKLKIVYDRYFTCGLGYCIYRERINPEGIQKTIQVLKTILDETSRFNIKKIIAVGTHFLRTIKNQQEFVKSIYTHTGIEISPISSHQEISLISSIIRFVYGVDFVIDVGGGSSEAIMDNIYCSLPYGAINTTKMFNLTYKKMKRALFKDINTFLLKQTKKYFRCIKENSSKECVITGGTAVIIGMIRAKIKKNPSYQAIEGIEVSRYDLNEVWYNIWEKKDFSFVPYDRKKIFPMGLIILWHIIKYFNVQTIIISTYGLRHGLILECNRK